MLKEYDMVRLKRIVPEIPLPQSTKGTIVLTHSHCYPPAYEVEFVDEMGQTLGIHTVQGNDLEAV